MSRPDPPERNEPDRPAPDPAGAAPFDPYRFGLPDHPVPPEYAPPGYVFPQVAPPPPPQAPAQGAPVNPWAPPAAPPPAYGGQPYGQHPQYPYGVPPPPLHHAYGPPKPGNGKAIAAMVLGIASIIFFWLTIIDLALIIPAVVFGIVALGDARARNTGGRGQAIAGLVCAGVAVLLIVVAVIFVLHAADKCGGITNSGDPGFNTCLKHHL